MSVPKLDMIRSFNYENAVVIFNCSEEVYEGIIYPTPLDETRTEFGLWYEEGDKCDYVPLFLERIIEFWPRETRKYGEHIFIKLNGLENYSLKDIDLKTRMDIFLGKNNEQRILSGRRCFCYSV